MRNFIVAALLLLSGVASAQSNLAGTGFRCTPGVTAPASFAVGQCTGGGPCFGFWCPSTGPYANTIVFSNSSATNVPFLPPSVSGQSGKVLSNDGTSLTWAAAGGTGTVTSAGMTVPSILSISGSPITGSGTFALTLANQNANLVFAGPQTGGATTPGFRALVDADIPPILTAHQLVNSQLSGSFSTVRVSFAAVDQYAIVKYSTTAGRVTMLGTADSAALMTGVAMTSAGSAGLAITVQEIQGIEATFINDGSSSIAIGDLVQPSTTVAGRAMKGTTSPVCTATSAVAATLNATFTCL